MGEEGIKIPPGQIPPFLFTVTWKCLACGNHGTADVSSPMPDKLEFADCSRCNPHHPSFSGVSANMNDKRGMAQLSMADFEARGHDALAYIMERYNAKYLRIARSGPERSDGDVGAFSLERHDGVPGWPKYGLLTTVPCSLIYIGLTEPKELKHVPFELRAAWAACGVMQKMLVAEAMRLDAEREVTPLG